jgi:hypothetical protein
MGNTLPAPLIPENLSSKLPEIADPEYKLRRRLKFE